MYKVVIAEDSKPILRNIKALLEAAELPIEIVCTAYNGEEALEYIERHAVDVLLTDIRMPKLDGLGLIERALQVRPHLKVVLISSYSDFEYTRKAINLKVSDYLLKPVEQTQLNETLHRVIDALKEKRASQQAVLHGIVEPSMQAELQLGKAFYEQPKRAMLLCRHPFSSGTQWSFDRLESALKELCSPHSCWLLPVDQGTRFLLLASASLEERYDTAVTWMQAVQHKLRELELEISAVCRFKTESPERLSAVYHELDQCLQQELTTSGPVLLEGEHCRPFQRIGEGAFGSFAELIRQRQKEPFMLKLRELLAYWAAESVRWVELEHMLTVFDGAIREALQELGAGEQALTAGHAASLLDADSYAQFSERLLAWSEEAFQELQALNRKSAEELFELMDEYMQHHKYDPITISDLSAKFHVSPSYVSRIVKRFTDETFVHYFMKLKIEEARKQLKEKPTLKIKELSDALSFTDQHYFSRVFKEYVGCSPSEYREQANPTPPGDTV